MNQENERSTTFKQLTSNEYTALTKIVMREGKKSNEDIERITQALKQNLAPINLVGLFTNMISVGFPNVLFHIANHGKHIPLLQQKILINHAITDGQLSLSTRDGEDKTFFYYILKHKWPTALHFIAAYSKSLDEIDSLLAFAQEEGYSFVVRVGWEKRPLRIGWGETPLDVALDSENTIFTALLCDKYSKQLAQPQPQSNPSQLTNGWVDVRPEQGSSFTPSAPPITRELALRQRTHKLNSDLNLNGLAQALNGFVTGAGGFVNEAMVQFELPDVVDPVVKTKLVEQPDVSNGMGSVPNLESVEPSDAPEVKEAFTELREVIQNLDLKFVIDPNSPVITISCRVHAGQSQPISYVPLLVCLYKIQHGLKEVDFEQSLLMYGNHVLDVKVFDFEQLQRLAGLDLSQAKLKIFLGDDLSLARFLTVLERHKVLPSEEEAKEELENVSKEIDLGVEYDKKTLSIALSIHQYTFANQLQPANFEELIELFYSLESAFFYQRPTPARVFIQSGRFRYDCSALDRDIFDNLRDIDFSQARLVFEFSEEKDYQQFCDDMAPIQWGIPETTIVAIEEQKLQQQEAEKRLLQRRPEKVEQQLKDEKRALEPFLETMPVSLNVNRQQKALEISIPGGKVLGASVKDLNPHLSLYKFLRAFYFREDSRDYREVILLDGMSEYGINYLESEMFHALLKNKPSACCLSYRFNSNEALCEFKKFITEKLEIISKEDLITWKLYHLVSEINRERPKKPEGKQRPSWVTPLDLRHSQNNIRRSNTIKDNEANFFQKSKIGCHVSDGVLIFTAELPADQDLLLFPGVDLMSIYETLREVYSDREMVRCIFYQGNKMLKDGYNATKLEVLFNCQKITRAVESVVIMLNHPFKDYQPQNRESFLGKDFFTLFGKKGHKEESNLVEEAVKPKAVLF